MFFLLSKMKFCFNLCGIVVSMLAQWTLDLVLRLVVQVLVDSYNLTRCIYLGTTFLPKFQYLITHGLEKNIIFTICQNIDCRGFCCAILEFNSFTMILTYIMYFNIRLFPLVFIITKFYEANSRLVLCRVRYFYHVVILMNKHQVEKIFCNISFCSVQFILFK